MNFPHQTPQAPPVQGPQAPLDLLCSLHGPPQPALPTVATPKRHRELYPKDSAFFRTVLLLLGVGCLFASLVNGAVVAACGLLFFVLGYLYSIDTSLAQLINLLREKDDPPNEEKPAVTRKVSPTALEVVTLVTLVGIALLGVAVFFFVK